MQQYVYKTGVRVIIHNQSIVSFPDEDGFDVPAGKQTNVAISRTIINRLPEPFSNCIDELTESVAQKNDVLKEMFDQKQTNKIKMYQQNYCLKICQQNYFIRMCGCFSYALKSLNLSTITLNGCYEQTELDCIESADVQFANSDEINICYSKCPQACHETKFEYKMSQAAFPTRSYASQLNSSNISGIDYFQAFLQKKSTYAGPTYEIVRQTGLMLNLFYESRSIASINEWEAFSFQSLISSIGGNMGLFTGASILSLIELVEYFISLLTLLFFKPHSQPQQQKQQKQQKEK